MELALLFGGLLVFLLIGVPIAFAMGLASLIFILVFGANLTTSIIPQSMTTGINNHPLLAIPLFFLAGELMNRGGITQRLVDCFMAWAGHLKGGLGHVMVLTNMALAGISGSAVADAAMSGPVLIPSMVRGGYGKAYSAALVGAAAIIGPIIPPSIPMILYGALADTSVARLFLSGALPGVMIGIYLMFVNGRIARRRGYGGEALRPTLPQRVGVTWKATPALLTPVIVLGGILTGVVTPTEAGLLAVVYAMLLGLLYGAFRLGELSRLWGQVALDSAIVLIIVGSGASFGWILANLGVGPEVVKALLAISENKWVVLAIVNVILLVLGCLMDPIAILVIFTPVFVPLMKTLGVDLVHFGLIMTLNLMIGLMTPPVGYLLYISTAISGARMEDVVRESVPFLIALFVCLIIVTYVPAFVLFLPDLVMGKP